MDDNRVDDMFSNWLKKGKKKRKGVKPEVLFDGPVKKLDVRNATFIWLKGGDGEEEYYADVSIEKVVIDLPDGMLSKKVQCKTEKGLIKLKLGTILENLSNRDRYFKFINLNRPVHFRIYGIDGGDVEVTVSKGDD